MMEQVLSPLRFCGNRNNPNYPAVRHLLNTYATHLGTRLHDIEKGDADVYWDRKGDGKGHPCIVIPGRLKAEAEMGCAWTQGGFPVPTLGLQGFTELSGQAGRDPTKPLSLKEEQPPKVLDFCGSFALVNKGGILQSDWDLLSFCADILFKRADFLPQYREASREACYERLSDKQLNLAKQPWVDLWMFKILGHLPRFQAIINELPAKSRLWLTHDLDNLSKWRIRSVLGQLARTPLHLLRGQFGLLRRNYGEMLKRAFTGRDPFETLDRIHALEGLRQSASFFLANGLDHLFHRYELSQPRYKRVLDDCLRAKKDIGLHGQVQVIANPSGIKAEVDKLAGLADKPVHLNRQHYLRWDAAKTFAGLDTAGIRVDSTLGYNDTPGFRTGTAWPYLWFDCATDTVTQLLEVPLILAEFQFYDPQKFDLEMVCKVIQEYLEITCKVGGVFTVLFHNQYFYEAEFPGHSQVYADLIAMANLKALADFNPAQTYAQYTAANVDG